MNTNPPETNLRRARIAGSCLLVVLPLLAYLPALGAGFVWDDDAYVTMNPLLTEPDGLRRIWFSFHSQSQYFPLVYTVFRAEHTLWGLHPFGYHLVNVLLHIANAFLVWIALRRLAAPGAWLAAAIFALHPVQVESVAWVTELKNLLSAFFCLLAVLAWLRFLEHRRGAYFLAFGFYVLALLAKTTACTLPAALLLVVWWRNEPINLRRLLQIAPFVLLGLAMGFLSIWWERHLGNYRHEYALDFSIAERVLISSRAVWFYLGKLLWPTQLAFSYPRWDINAADPVQYGWIVACVLAALALVWSYKKWGRGPVVAAAFYVATLSPMLGFVSLFTFRYSFVADHYQYFASIGPAALFAAFVRRYIGSLRVRSVLVTVLIGLLCVVTFRQTQVYHSEETLYRDILAKNPDSLLAHFNLAAVLAEKGDADSAIEHYRHAARLRPDAREAHNNLGALLAMRGELDEAIHHFSEAVRINPDYPPGHNNLGRAFSAKGRAADAIREYREAVRLSPDWSAPARELAWILATEPDDALRNPTEAVRLAENICLVSGKNVSAEFLDTLAAACASAGRFTEAVSVAEKAHELAVARREPVLAEEIEARCSLYKSEKPYRRPATPSP